MRVCVYYTIYNLVSICALTNQCPCVCAQPSSIRFAVELILNSTLDYVYYEHNNNDSNNNTHIDVPGDERRNRVSKTVRDISLKYFFRR